MSKINENFLIRGILGTLIVAVILTVYSSISYFVSTANDTASMASEGARWTQDEQDRYAETVGARITALENEVYRLAIEVARGHGQ